jgi:hypothetical protein
MYGKLWGKVGKRRSLLSLARDCWVYETRASFLVSDQSHTKLQACTPRQPDPKNRK